MEDVQQISEWIGFPIIVRPSFTLVEPAAAWPTTGKTLMEIAKVGLDASMIHEVMLEQSVLGWKEYEFEVMRDKADNVVIICSIENLDPMGFIRVNPSPWRRPRP